MSVQVRPGTWAEASLGLPILAKDGGIWTLVSCTPGAFYPDDPNDEPRVAEVVMQDTRDIDRKATVYPAAWDAPIRIVLPGWEREPFPYEVVDVSEPVLEGPGVDHAKATLEAHSVAFKEKIAAGERRVAEVQAAIAEGRPIPPGGLYGTLTAANSGEPVAIPHTDPMPELAPVPPPPPSDMERVRPVTDQAKALDAAIVAGIHPATPPPRSLPPSAPPALVQTIDGQAAVVTGDSWAPPAPPVIEALKAQGLAAEPLAQVAALPAPFAQALAGPVLEEPAAQAPDPTIAPVQAPMEVWAVPALTDATVAELHTHMILFHGSWTQELPQKGKALVKELHRLHDEAPHGPGNPGLGHEHRKA